MTPTPFWLTDLHCHLLPGLDDGPATLDDALALASLLVQQNVRTVAATVHQLGEYRSLRRAAADAALVRLQRALAEEDLPLHVELSGEWMLGSDDVTRLDELWPHLWPLGSGGRYALIEFPFDCPPHAALVCQQMVEKGVTPVLAHVERYRDLCSNTGRLAALREAGMLIQANADAIAGHRGLQKQAVLRRLLKAGSIDIVASDAHDTASRCPRLDEAYGTLAGWVGRGRARWLVSDAPAALVRGEPLPPRPPIRWF